MRRLDHQDSSHGCKSQPPTHVMRIEDLLSPKQRCSTLDTLVGDMVHRLLLLSSNGGQEGVWYSIPVSLNREQHLCSEQGWNCLLNRIQQRMHEATAESTRCCVLRNRLLSGSDDGMCSCNCGSSSTRECTCMCNREKRRWHCEIFPASKLFVVRRVLREEDKWKQRLDPMNNQDHHMCWESDKNLPVMAPICHLYMQCTRQTQKDDGLEQQTDGIAGRGLQFMDTMYNRWAVQNAVQLRERILQRKRLELGVPCEMGRRKGRGWNEEGRSENVLGKRGLHTKRALESMRTSNPRLCST